MNFVSNPLVSIIVPVYKVEQYLRNCIDNVLTQTYKNWEMILVDDGSPDGCPVICDEYAERDKRVIVIHCQNGGQSRARNRALDYPPKGDFVAFLDSDDFWSVHYLETLIELQQMYNADIVQCDSVRGEAKVFPRCDNAISIDVFDNHEVFLKEKANIVMWGKIYRSSLFVGIRMPEGLYNEDDWTTWKLYYRCKKIVCTSQRLYYYTVNPDSTMARLKKKPDLRYFKAYDERIGFFVGTGEKDLEHCSRLQFCKSLLLTYRHNQLNEEERLEIKNKFDESWKELKQSPYIRPFYKMLFTTFHHLPMLTSKITAKIR